MLVIRGNTRVADIYFGEFMRIFDHLYSRYIVEKMKKEGRATRRPGSSKKTPRIGCPNTSRTARKQLRRLYFMNA